MNCQLRPPAQASAGCASTSYFVPPSIHHHQRLAARFTERGAPRWGHRGAAPAPAAAAAKETITHHASTHQPSQAPPATPPAASQPSTQAPQPDVQSSVQLESLNALEWPAVCRQVACFCSTVMGAQKVLSGDMTIGRSQQESEKLLRQTAEALEANINLKGIFDIRPALEAATSGYSLSARQLEGLASTLQAVFDAKAAACATQPASPSRGAGEGQGTQALGKGGAQPQPGDSAAAAAAAAAVRFPELAAIAHGIGEEERDTLRTIQKCVKGGYVTDEANDKLSSLRQQRADNKFALRAAINEQAKLAFSKGASDSPGNQTLIRGRYCIGIKAGRQGDLPKGSTKVGQSQSGATHYYEPAPVVPLNNNETLLEEQERAEVAAVLGLLSQMVAASAPRLSALLAAVTELDVVAARAAHARWLRGVRPQFGSWERFRQQQRLRWQAGPQAEGVPSPAAAAACSALSLPAALHPLLLEPALPPLPEPPSVDDNSFDSDFQERGSWEVRRSLLTDAGAAAAAAGPRAAVPTPKPLDLKIPEAAAVVAITGPNTGGKTVTLKTAGLAALMAKAGLYLAMDDSAGAAPQLLWFDQVLADIGDTQSLQQNLSTFSGHVRRIRTILAATTPGSLVLLDEVGSGTDPLEGAALARAVLDRLAECSGLTLATTHHAELKTVAAEDARYVNVSMEFDVASLAPTYRLCWGAAGASNALDIAKALGFDSEVVREARSVAREVAARRRDQASHMAAVAESLTAQLAAAREELAGLREGRRDAEERAQALRDEQAELAALQLKIEESPRLIAKEVKTYAAQMQEAVDAFGQGQLTAEALSQAFAKLEANVPDLIAKAKGLQHESEPLKGDTVWVDKLSREAVVTRVVGEHVHVQPVPLKNAENDILSSITMDFFGTQSKRASYGLKYKKEDVRVLLRKGVEVDQGTAAAAVPGQG